MYTLTFRGWFVILSAKVYFARKVELLMFIKLHLQSTSNTFKEYILHVIAYSLYWSNQGCSNKGHGPLQIFAWAPCNAETGMHYLEWEGRRKREGREQGGRDRGRERRAAWESVGKREESWDGQWLCKLDSMSGSDRERKRQRIKKKGGRRDNVRNKEADKYRLCSSHSCSFSY